MISTVGELDQCRSIKVYAILNFDLTPVSVFRTDTNATNRSSLRAFERNTI